MSNAIVPFNDIERMALAVSKSQLFGMKTPDQAIALMLVAQSEGLHPARAAMEYHVIQGRPALKADAMLARFQAAGGKVEWKDYTNFLLAPSADELHPMQQAFHECHALQCGYCTPGMVMAAVSLLDEVPNPTERQVREGLEGNLCRCTGYHNIVKAVLQCAAQGGAK